MIANNNDYIIDQLPTINECDVTNDVIMMSIIEEIFPEIMIRLGSRITHDEILRAFFCVMVEKMQKHELDTASRIALLIIRALTNGGICDEIETLWELQQRMCELLMDEKVLDSWVSYDDGILYTEAYELANQVYMKSGARSEVKWANYLLRENPNAEYTIQYILHANLGELAMCNSTSWWECHMIISLLGIEAFEMLKNTIRSGIDKRELIATLIITVFKNELDEITDMDRDRDASFDMPFMGVCGQLVKWDYALYGAELPDRFSGLLMIHVEPYRCEIYKNGLLWVTGNEPLKKQQLYYKCDIEIGRAHV